MCADGAFMREVLLSEPATDTFVQFLQHFGPVMLLPEMGPGFFKFELNLKDTTI